MFALLLSEVVLCEDAVLVALSWLFLYEFCIADMSLVKPVEIESGIGSQLEQPAPPLRSVAGACGLVRRSWMLAMTLLSVEQVLTRRATAAGAVWPSCEGTCSACDGLAQKEAECDPC